MAQQMPPAAWYPDPHNAALLRYWDGQQWTQHQAPTAPAAPGTSPAVDAAALSPSPALQEPAAIETEHAHTKKIGVFNARGVAREVTEELRQLRVEMARIGALDVVELERKRERLKVENVEAEAGAQRQRDDLRRELDERKAASDREQVVLEDRLRSLRRQVVVTEETAILQEVGVYQYRHPLSDSVEYKDALSRLQDKIKTMARIDGRAVQAAQGWTVNGSEAQGRTMIRNYSKLMLRAYNAEADNLVRSLKPYKIDSAKDRLGRVSQTIERLGKTMQIRIAPEYQRLRIQELELTADYQEKAAREKEREREERERLREERQAQADIERERERLRKEQQHYTNALEALLAKGDVEAAERMRGQIADIEKAIEEVDYRAANIRAGYVYVISNLGSFGERMIKIGMTRRLEPRDRIRELSDASVPFNFDVHALFFSDDAVGIETKMHQHFADRRVNQVNLRREFFYATPAEAREQLLSLTGDLLQFEESPEAVEFHQSRNAPA